MFRIAALLLPAGALASQQLSGLERVDFVYPVLSAGGNHHRRLGSDTSAHSTQIVAAQEGGYASHAPTVQFKVDSTEYGQVFTLELERSDALFSDRFASTASSTEHGVTAEPGVELCHYHGKVVEDARSLVVGATCEIGTDIDEGLTAHVTAFGHHWILRPLTDAEIAASAHEAPDAHNALRRPHALFRHGDSKEKIPTGCGAGEGGVHSHGDHAHVHFGGDGHVHNHAGREDTLKTPDSPFARSLAAEVSAASPIVVEPTPSKTLSESTSTAVKERRRLGASRRRLSCSTVATDYSAYRPRDGCTCKDPWSLTGSGINYCGGTCGNPDGDSGGPWCFTNEATCDAKWKYCEVTQVAPTRAPVAAPTNSAASTGTGCAVGDKVYTPYCSSACNTNCAYTTTYSSVITSVTSSAIGISWDDGQPACSAAVGVGYPHSFVYKSVNNALVPCSSIAPSGAALPTKQPTQGASPTPYPTVTPASPTKQPTNAAPTTRAPTSGMVVAPSSKHNVELLIVNDVQNYVRLGSDLKAVKSNAVLIANMVRQIYTQLSLEISIVFVHLHTFTDVGAMGSLYTTPSYTMETYLNRLSDWRSALESAGGALGGYDASSDNTQLLAGSDYSAGTTGLAWVNTMCNRRTSCGIDEDLFGWQYTAQTLAHEMGHNWGSSHDGSGNTCDSSSKIMASSGCSNCGFTEKTFSSCSKSVISATVQSLQSSGSANCLANIPTRYAPSPVCGDFVVSGDEECDDGAAGSVVCDTNCKQKAGVQCSTGQCCDTSTGQFKSASAVCRATVNSCDLADYCSGTSAACGSDSYKADGTMCSSEGSSSKCYRGNCVSRSSQCGASMTGYQGTWVAGPLSGGGSATCANPASTPASAGWDEDDECGELKCTNSEWDNGGCYKYDCPSGYSCTLSNGEKISGPSSRYQCNCIVHPASVTKVYVADGTPCGLSSGTDKICVSRQCVARASSAASTTTSAADSAVGQPTGGTTNIDAASCPKDGAGVECSGVGDCDDKGACKCRPGFLGDACTETVACDVNCAGALHRTQCIAPGLCGECLSGFAVALTSGGATATEMASAKCTRQAATAITTRAVGTHGGALSGPASATGPSAAVDNDVETAWKAYAADSTDTSFTEPPTLTVAYAAPFALRHYTVTSAPSSPAMDPKNWMLHGRATPADEWTLLDHRNGVVFSARRETISFFPSHMERAANVDAGYREYRLTVTDVADAASQSSGASITLDSATGQATSSTVVLGNVKPLVQVGELGIFGDVGNAGVAASAAGEAPEGMAPGGVAALVILLVLGAVAVVGVVAAAVVVGVILHRKRSGGEEEDGKHTELTPSGLVKAFGVESEAELNSVRVGNSIRPGTLGESVAM